VFLPNIAEVMSPLILGARKQLKEIKENDFLTI
jgi:hypothetical protein